jgi:hypothetical protein
LIALAERHDGWVVGFGDEVWWSRLAQPRLHTWGGQAWRLVEKRRAKSDPEPKALACSGLLRSDTEEMLLRLVSGRSVSRVTTEFLTWVLGRLAADGKRVLVLVSRQRRLAHLARGAVLDSGAQPAGQARGRGARARMPVADQEPVAEPDRAALGAWQARDC